MEGTLDKLIAERGQGVALIETVLGREPLGSWPGARVRVDMWMHIPPVPGRVRHALLTIGLETASRGPLPIRARITLDGASVAREVRPQFTVALDDGYYHKAVYNVKPILLPRLGRGDFHKLQAFYDLAQPLYFRDATLLLVVENEHAEYAVSMLTGAKVLEPGEVTVEYPPFYQSFGGRRVAHLVIHSPYHDSSFEIIVAGSQPEEVAGQGSFPVRVPFTYKGNLIPVSVRYREAPYRFYPRKAIVTDIVLEEFRMPEPKVRIEVTEVNREDHKVEVKGVIANEGVLPVNRLTVALVALGGQVASRKLKVLEPGGRFEFRLRTDLSRLPLQPQKLQLTVSGFVLGRRIERFMDIEL